MTQIISRRITKYTNDVLSILCQLQHAKSPVACGKLIQKLAILQCTVSRSVCMTTVQLDWRRHRSRAVCGMIFRRNRMTTLFAANAIIYEISRYPIQCAIKLSAILAIADLTVR